MGEVERILVDGQEIPVRLVLAGQTTRRLVFADGFLPAPGTDVVASCRPGWCGSRPRASLREGLPVSTYAWGMPTDPTTAEMLEHLLGKMDLRFELVQLPQQ